MRTGRDGLAWPFPASHTHTRWPRSMLPDSMLRRDRKPPEQAIFPPAGRTNVFLTLLWLLSMEWSSEKTQSKRYCFDGILLILPGLRFERFQLPNVWYYATPQSNWLGRFVNGFCVWWWSAFASIWMNGRNCVCRAEKIPHFDTMINRLEQYGTVCAPQYGNTEQLGKLRDFSY